MKIAIYVDPLMGKGGGARLTIDLANHLNADIITSGFNKKLLPELKKNIKVINIGNTSINFNYSLGYLFEAPLRFLFCKEYDYDVNIFIGTFSIFAAKKNKKNIWLCLTPNRIMYDLKKWKLQTPNLFKRLVYRIHILLFERVDQFVARNNFKKIVSQNHNVQDRIEKYYGQESDIIYSSINTSKFKFNKFGDFFLTVSRLVPEKRMDLIAEAFTKMPNKKLVIVGDGPEKNKLKEITKNYKNIKLLDKVTDQKLSEIYADCLATIYIPLDEDFGLVPIEGMASGKACIAVNEGGCKETITDGKTGIFIEPTILAIIEAVEKYDISAAKNMKAECMRWAKKFDIFSYISQWKKIINALGNYR